MAEPTHEQRRDITRACLAVQAVLSDERNAGDPKVIAETVEHAFNMSPWHAVMVMAAYADLRIQQIEDALQRAHGPDARFVFPRDGLANGVPPMVGLPTLRTDCVDLIEAVHHAEPPGELITRLLEKYGQRAFEMLAGLTQLMGMQVVQVDPDVTSLADLVQQESLTSEIGWIERGEDV